VKRGGKCKNPESALKRATSWNSAKSRPGYTRTLLFIYADGKPNGKSAFNIFAIFTAFPYARRLSSSL